MHVQNPAMIMTSVWECAKIIEKIVVLTVTILFWVWFYCCSFWNIWSFQRIFIGHITEEIYKLGFSAEMKKSGKTNRFEPTYTSWANDFPECVASFKREGWFSFFDNITTGFNLEESSSKWSPKNKKRCIVMLYFFLFWSLQLSIDREIMEMNFRKQKRFLFKIDPFTKTALSFVTSVKVWKIRFNLYSLFFRVLNI